MYIEYNFCGKRIGGLGQIKGQVTSRKLRIVIRKLTITKDVKGNPVTQEREFSLIIFLTPHVKTEEI